MGAAQPAGRVVDRGAGLVGEEPELIVVADPRVSAELVDELRPARRVRIGAVDEDERDPIGAKRLQKKQPVEGLVPRYRLQNAELPDAPRLGVPDARVLEPESQSCGRVGLEWQRAPVDGDAPRPVFGIELEPPLESAAREAGARVLEPEEGRHRDPCARSDAPRSGHGGARLLLRHSRHQRRADARAPVTVPKSPDRQRGRGDEMLEAVAEPDEVRLRERDVERA
jgi:hypothetical protein